MSIVYKLGKNLYINLTNRCGNRCDFCLRFKSEGVGDGASLWLEREPAVPEVLEALRGRGWEKYPEIVFCGYGEPLERAGELLEIARTLKKERPDVKIRVNTNGLAPRSKERLAEFGGVIDAVSVSLNFPDAERYAARCLPERGVAAYAEMLDFTLEAARFVPEVVMSVIDDLPEADVERCRVIARERGAVLRLREVV